MPDTHFLALNQLSTEELRHRAFSLARERHDVGFFVSVLRHLSDAYAAEQLDGSTGSITNSIDDIVGMWSKLAGRGLGDGEPLLRAAFIDYLLRHHDSSEQ